MKYHVAFREAEELQTVVQRWIKEEHATNIEHLLQKCKVLINNAYPITHQFGSMIESLILNFENSHDAIRIRKLADVIDLIVDDLRIKSKIAVFPKSNLQDLTESQTKIANITKQKKELEAEIINHKTDKDKLNSLVEAQKGVIEGLKNQLRGFEIIDKAEKPLGIQNKLLIERLAAQEYEIKELKKAHGNDSYYKISTYGLLFSFLTTVNFGVPYIFFDQINWKAASIIEVIILTAVIVFYTKHIPGWLQFAVGTALAILSILFSS